jgi:hypothetical protein
MQTTRFKTRLSFGTLALCALSCSAVAEDDDGVTHWNVSGFGTIGYTQSDKYDERIPRRTINQSGATNADSGLMMDSRMGFQVKGQLTDHWDVVGQFVARQQLAERLEDHVDIAFARYRSNQEWEIAFGRLSFDLFFLSDHTNIGYSYDWVRPPTEFYGFMPFDSFDGIKIANEWGDFDSSWRWNLSVGKVKSKFDADVLAQSDDVDSTRGEPIYASELSWQGGPWHLRGSLAHYSFEQEYADRDQIEKEIELLQPYWPDVGRIIHDFSSQFKIRYGSLGASWQQDGWKVQGEWNIIDSDSITFDGQRAYVSVAKRVDQLLPFFAVGYASDNRVINYGRPNADAGLEPIYDEVINAIENFRHNQHSFSLGVRWDFAQQKALKLQCDQFHFDAHSGSIYGRVDLQYPQAETKSWCSVAFDWVF